MKYRWSPCWTPLLPRSPHPLSPRPLSACLSDSRSRLHADAVLACARPTAHEVYQGWSSGQDRSGQSVNVSLCVRQGQHRERRRHEWMCKIVATRDKENVQSGEQLWLYNECTCLSACVFLSRFCLCSCNHKISPEKREKNPLKRKFPLTILALGRGRGWVSFCSRVEHCSTSRGGHLGGLRSYGGQECGGRSGGRTGNIRPKRMLSKFSQPLLTNLGDSSGWQIRLWESVDSFLPPSLNQTRKPRIVVVANLPLCMWPSIHRSYDHIGWICCLPLTCASSAKIHWQCEKYGSVYVHSVTS